MFQNVLVGVDGSPNGRDAVALASRLIDEGGKLTLAHVHPGELNPLHAITPRLIAEERAASDQLLAQEREHAGVEAELVSIIAATPGAALHAQAETQGADLIVVGSCGHGPFGRAMLGDNTRQALNGAPCAVAIASKGYAQAPKPFAHLGVAYNGSPESDAALKEARSLAAHTRARITVLEVVSIPSYAYAGALSPAIGEGLEIVLDEANKRIGLLEGVEGRAVYGLAGEELAAFGDEVDILVVGSRGYGPWRRLVLGSTSDYLERHARCSLLVLARAATPAQQTPTADAQTHASAPAAA